MLFQLLLTGLLTALPILAAPTIYIRQDVNYTINHVNSTFYGDHYLNATTNVSVTVGPDATCDCSGDYIVRTPLEPDSAVFLSCAPSCAFAQVAMGSDFGMKLIFGPLGGVLAEWVMKPAEWPVGQTGDGGPRSYFLDNSTSVVPDPNIKFLPANGAAPEPVLRPQKDDPNKPQQNKGGKVIIEPAPEQTPA